MKNKITLKLQINQGTTLYIDHCDIQADAFDEETGKYHFDVSYEDEAVSSDGRKLLLLEPHNAVQAVGYVKVFDVYKGSEVTATLYREYQKTVQRIQLDSRKNIVTIPKHADILSFEWYRRAIIMWYAADSWNEREEIILHVMPTGGIVMPNYKLVGVITNGSDSGFSGTTYNKHIFKEVGAVEQLMDVFKF